MQASHSYAGAAWRGLVVRIAAQPRGVALAVLAGASSIVVIANLFWLRAHRVGMPFNIDEAGYLQRAIRDGDALRTGGISALWHLYREPDPQAPLLPLFTGVWHFITNSGPLGSIASEQVFLVVAVASTYTLARHLNSNHPAAIVAAASIAALPGIITGGQSFMFALPATALMTAVLSTQLGAGHFERLRPALVWGLLFGLALLTRTVMLALLPACLGALVVRLVAVRAGARQWFHLMAGAAVAAIVAGSWYTATWRPVWDYLTSYAYGIDAVGYGPQHSPLSISWWTARFVHVVNTEIYAPLLIAALVSTAILLASLVLRRPRRRSLATVLGSPRSMIGIVLVVDYLLLSSTRNVGSDFELPLVPAAFALLFASVSRTGRRRRMVALGIAGAAAAFSFTAAESYLPGPPTRSEFAIGSWGIVAYDDRGALVYYGMRFLPPTSVGTESVLRRWETSNVDLARLLFREADAHGKPDPVIFFSTQDPFVNTNSLALLAQERGISLPTGLLEPPSSAGESFAAQLQDPARGLPDALIVGPRRPSHSAGIFYPPVDMNAVRRAARGDGFRPRGRVKLPDGREVTLWWRIGKASARK
jgi:dolichyl-phosphate-mannose-protein mannosyltransferase